MEALSEAQNPRLTAKDKLCFPTEAVPPPCFLPMVLKYLWRFPRCSSMFSTILPCFAGCQVLLTPWTSLVLSLGTWEGIGIYSEDASVSGGDRETDVGTVLGNSVESVVSPPAPVSLHPLWVPTGLHESESGGKHLWKKTREECLCVDLGKTPRFSAGVRKWLGSSWPGLGWGPRSKLEWADPEMSAEVSWVC